MLGVSRHLPPGTWLLFDICGSRYEARIPYLSFEYLVQLACFFNEAEGGSAFSLFPPATTPKNVGFRADRYGHSDNLIIQTSQENTILAAKIFIYPSTGLLTPPIKETNIRL